MRRANSRQSSGDNLATLGHELGQKTNVFVIDCFDFLDAELANFLATEKFAPTLAASAGPTWARWTTLSAELPVSTGTISTWAIAERWTVSARTIACGTISGRTI